MPKVLVTLESGESAFIPDTEYDRTKHTLAPDQVATVAPVGGDDQFAVGQDITEASLARGLYEEVSPERRAELERERTQDQFDTTTNTAKQGVLGAASGLTFSLSDIAFADRTGFGREQQAREREAGGSAYAIGSAIGSVAPTIFSGGAGAAGTLARLTPVGKMASVTGRYVGRGGVGRAIAGGAVEEAVAAGGDYLARTHLDEDASFSGEALAGSMLGGAVIGGIGGGAGHFFAKGAGRVAKKLGPDDARIGQLLDPPGNVLDPTVGLTPPTTVAGGLKKGQKKWTNYRKVVSRKLATDDAGELRRLGDAVDSLSDRSIKEMDDVLSQRTLIDTATSETRELIESTSGLARDLAEAGTRTKNAWKAYADEVGLATAKKSVVREASPEVEQRLAETIAESDQLAVIYQRQLGEVQARLQIVPAAPAVPVSEASSRLGGALRKASEKIGGARSAVGGVTDKATDVLGMVEAVGATGAIGDMPRPSDAIGGDAGPLLSYYLQYKGARAAGRRLGMLPSSKATKAATKVGSATDGLKMRARLMASKGASRVAASPRTPLLAAQAAGIIHRLPELQENVAAQVAEETDETTSATTMATMDATNRAIGYLTATAPKDPLPVRPPWAPKWQPTALEAREFGRRIQAVEDPEWAIDRATTDPTALIEFEVLAQVYPNILARYRSEMMENAEGIKAALPASHFEGLSRRFGLPLTTAQIVPGYLQAQTLTPPQLATPQFTKPSTPGASPSVQLEATDRRDR